MVTFLRGGGVRGSPEERPYDVSREQNRHVTLPLGKYCFRSNIEQVQI